MADGYGSRHCVDDLTEPHTSSGAHSSNSLKVPYPHGLSLSCLLDFNSVLAGRDLPRAPPKLSSYDYSIYVPGETANLLLSTIGNSQISGPLSHVADLSLFLTLFVSLFVYVLSRVRNRSFLDNSSLHLFQEDDII